MLPRHSVLLDVTRARVAKHYGMEPSELRLPYPDASVEAAGVEGDLVDTSSASILRSSSDSLQQQTVPRMRRQPIGNEQDANLPSAFMSAMSATDSGSLQERTACSGRLRSKCGVLLAIGNPGCAKADLWGNWNINPR